MLTNFDRSLPFRTKRPSVAFQSSGQPIAFEAVGGSKELLLNNEVVFPIIEALGLRGVVFLDAGNAYRLSQSIDPTKLQAAAGGGVRWRSPFGPLRIEIGFPINPRPNDLKTDFIFGAGGNL